MILPLSGSKTAFEKNLSLPRSLKTFGSGAGGMISPVAPVEGSEVGVGSGVPVTVAVESGAGGTIPPIAPVEGPVVGVGSGVSVAVAVDDGTAEGARSGVPEGEVGGIGARVGSGVTVGDDSWVGAGTCVSVALSVEQAATRKMHRPTNA